MDDNKKKFQEISEFYNKKYYTNVASNKNNSLHYNNILKKIFVRKGQTILDVACGTGEWLSHISNYDLATYGIDISEKAIRSCKDNSPKSNVVIVTGGKSI